MTAKDLKNALLQEAVQGKLVPQIASEGNARDLLEEIRKEKLSHGLDFANAKSGKRKSKKETALAGSNPCDITEEEIPFDIPESWCWCRLGEVVEIKTNLVDSAKYPDYIQIAPDDIGKGTGTLIKEKRTVKQKSIKSINHLFHEDMLLYSKIRPRLQKVVYVDFEGLCSADMYPLDTKINKHYLKYVLLSDFFDQEIKVFENRVKMPKLNIEQLNSTIIPLPPLSEQKRIVAAIEKFMPLIEEYGKKETQLKAINEEIGTLTKKAILQEAVQGKLVPQIASEGNAKDLLEEIKKEKLSHGLDFANAKSGKRKSKKETALAGSNPCDIKEEEIPFDIPENWCWCRLGEISIFNGGYAFKSENYVSKENGVRILRISDFDENGIKEKAPVYYPYNSEMENYKLSVNDIIMCMTGGTVGKSYLVKVLTEEMYVNQRVADIKCSSHVDVDYIYSVILSHHIQLSIQENKNSTNDNISAELIRMFMIPLPPLAEQKRIVATIEKMLPLCEKLGV